MKYAMTLSGSGLAADSGGEKRCKCVFNPRTKRSSKLCFVGKSKKNRSGWQFVKGGCR